MRGRARSLTLSLCHAHTIPLAESHCPPLQYSFLDNAKLPAAYARSAAVRTGVALGDGAQEMARLRGLKNAKTLWLTNIPKVADALWVQGEPYRNKGAASKGKGGGSGLLLAPREWRAFRKEFGGLQGGWCCAPRGQQPHNAGFHIMHAPAAKQ